MIAESAGPPSPPPQGRGGPRASHSSLLASPVSPRSFSPSMSNASPRAHVVCRICEERVLPAMLERHSQVRGRPTGYTGYDGYISSLNPLPGMLDRPMPRGG